MTTGKDLHQLSHSTQVDESHYGLSQGNTVLGTSALERWIMPLTFALSLTGPLLLKYLQTVKTCERGSLQDKKEVSPTVSHAFTVFTPLVILFSGVAEWATSFTKQFGPSAVVCLRFFHKEIYVVSGAEYINAIFKNTKGLTSTDGINTALHNMFDMSKQDLKFFEADSSGISHDPHPQSTTGAENRVHYFTHKSILHGLSGSNLTIAGQKFQAALQTGMEAVPVQDDWIEMDDLFGFLLPLISNATFRAICGADFLTLFPQFAVDFWAFNSEMQSLIKGWPRWTMTKAWQARDRCLSVMKQWRRINNNESSDVNALYQRRWGFFSKVPGLSDDATASSDLGVLWALSRSLYTLAQQKADIYFCRMSSSTVAATFWLMWHTIRDRELLVRGISEANASRTVDAASPFSFDTNKLCSQPLLQSTFAETLRLYVAAIFLRRPDFGNTQILDYTIPKDKIIIIDSAMAHMDKRNWNHGVMDEHSAESFWADRFLTNNSHSSRHHPTSPTLATCSTFSGSDSRLATATLTNHDLTEPRFSLTGYSGAWIPFGGGTHQCPGRHWVKFRMLLTFAIVNSAFDIELLDANQTLKVNMAKYSLGALPPAEKAKFRIRRKSIPIH